MIERIKAFFIKYGGYVIAVVATIFSINTVIKSKRSNRTIEKKIEATVAVDKSKEAIDNAEEVIEKNKEAIKSADEEMQNTEDLIKLIEEELKN